MLAEQFPHLALRQLSQHRKCSICTRHKLILRKVAHDRYARSAQLAEYTRHLHSQFLDRTRYWQSRAESRLVMTYSGKVTVCAIIDGMDGSKFKVPRSVSVLSSKDFSSLVRPHLDFHAVLAHGRLAFTALSPPWVMKDSSFCNELLAHTLHRISSMCDTRAVEYIIQCDNTCREVKNNTTLRLGGLWVGNHVLKRIEIRSLLSGHSHEDVDAFFGSITYFLERNLELLTRRALECDRMSRRRWWLRLALSGTGTSHEI